jgi:CRP-like cAMP-binding protein
MMIESELLNLEKKVLFKEGEPAKELLLIKSGHILCLKKSKDRLIPILIAKDQDIVGESAILEDKTYQYSAISLGHVETISISRAQFLDAFKKSPTWIKQLSELMVQRYSNTSSMIAENRIMSPLILADEEFTAEIEVELKKMIN